MNMIEYKSLKYQEKYPDSKNIKKTYLHYEHIFIMNNNKK